jgi:MFS transporter, DHA2 family, multidrug resistance protein
VILFDMNIVNVAMPLIGRSLVVDPSVTQWVRLGYLLPLIAAVLPSGRWLDQVGKRPALVVAAGCFAGAGVCAGLAPGIGTLIGARVVQGVFGALLYALTPTLATIAVRPQARARAMSVITTLGPIGAICGPTVGGALLDVFGWRAIFFTTVPVCLLAIAIGWATLPAGGGLKPPGRAWAVEAALLGGAVAAILLGLSFGGARGPAWFALAALAVPLLWIWRRRPESGAVRTILSGSAMRRLHVTVLAAATGFAAMHFLMPFFLERVLDAGAFTIGLTMLAIPVGMTLASPLGGILGDRLGAGRSSVAGVAVVTVGVALVVPVPPAWTPVDLAWRLGLVGLGLGLYGGPTQALTMSGAPGALISTTAGTVQLARTLGFALGPAMATAVWAGSEYTATGMRVALVAGVVAACAAVVALVPLWRVRTLRDRQ